MDFSFSTLMCGLLFGVIGMWMIRRGKSRGNALMTLIGLTLIVYPYFISNPWLDWGTGIVLCFIAKRID